MLNHYFIERQVLESVNSLLQAVHNIKRQVSQRIRDKSQTLHTPIPQQLKKYMATQQQKPGQAKKFQCKYCHKTFDDGRKLGGHISRSHPYYKYQQENSKTSKTPQMIQNDQSSQNGQESSSKVNCRKIAKKIYKQGRSKKQEKLTIQIQQVPKQQEEQIFVQSDDHHLLIEPIAMVKKQTSYLFNNDNLHHHHNQPFLSVQSPMRALDQLNLNLSQSLCLMNSINQNKGISLSKSLNHCLPINFESPLQMSQHMDQLTKDPNIQRLTPMQNRSAFCQQVINQSQEEESSSSSQISKTKQISKKNQKKTPTRRYCKKTSKDTTASNSTPRRISSRNKK